MSQQWNGARGEAEESVGAQAQVTSGVTGLVMAAKVVGERDQVVVCVEYIS
jgi:hypothetical protein